MVVTIYFDYYHPHAGLCNQLYLLTNHIHDCYNQGEKIFINKFNIDIFKKTRVPVQEVIDLEETNKNLKNLLGTEIIALECPETAIMKSLCIYPVSSIPILNCIQFNKNILRSVEHNKMMIKNGYYGIHFRLDVDSVLHYTFGKIVYDKYMNLANNSSILAQEYFKSLDQNKLEEYCNFLMKQYFQFLQHVGFDKTWFICTSILKNSFNDCMVGYLNKLNEFITLNHGSFYIPYNSYPERELNALVDLLVLRDSEKIIGFEGSSFSEGYCFKVNSIRKVTREYFFVKEYNKGI